MPALLGWVGRASTARAMHFKLRRTLSIMNSNTNDTFRVVICGKGNFLSSYLYTKDALKAHGHVEVIQSDDDDVIASADVIIPFMKRIDEPLIERSQNLKMVMQYGVGLEGVDIATATERGIWVCLIPGADVGNAQSCAEQAVYLALSILRDQKEMARSLLTNRIGWPTGRTIMVSHSFNASC
jgi:lactate dehydrogenase-like 2-hydroxyacid dehydrogenase